MNLKFLSLFFCISVCFYQYSLGQGGTSCASATTNPVLANVTYANQSTCGKLNNFLVANGQDYLYQYCATQDGCVQIHFNKLKPGDSVIAANAVLGVYSGCNFTTPITSINALVPAYTTTTSQTLSINVQAGQCYYILIDVNDIGASTADCIYFDLLLNFSPLITQSPGANNCSTITGNLVSGNSYANQTLCCVGNNYAPSAGNDWYYKYCSNSDGCLQLILDSIKNLDNTINSDLQVYIFDNCIGGNVVASVNVALPANNTAYNTSVIAQLTANTCYYILVTTNQQVGLGGCINYNIKPIFTSATGQTPGANICSNAGVNPFVLGTNYTNQTLCCVGNNYTPTAGNDWWYKYCPAQNGCLTLQLDSIINTDNTYYSDLTVTIFDSCSGGNVIGNKGVSIVYPNSPNSLTLITQLLANTCYYILITTNKLIGQGGCINYQFNATFTPALLQNPGGINCTIASTNPILANGTYYNHNLCCVGNNYAPTAGNDYFYKYCPTQDGCLIVNADSIVSKDINYYSDIYMYVFEGCPGANPPLTTNAVGIYYWANNNALESKLTVEAGKCYYILFTSNYVIGNGGCINYKMKTTFTPKVLQSPGANNCDSAKIKPQIVVGTKYNNHTTCCIGAPAGAPIGQETWNYYYCASDKGCLKILFDSIINVYNAGSVNIEVSQTFPTDLLIFSLNNNANVGYNGVDTFFAKIDVEAGNCYCIKITTNNFNCVNYDFSADFNLFATQLPGGNTPLEAENFEIYLGTTILNQTTCCLHNDEKNLGGQDWIYYFEAPKNGCVRVGIDSFINGNPNLLAHANLVVQKINLPLESHTWPVLGTVNQYHEGPELFFNVKAGDKFYVFIDEIVANENYDNCMNYDMSLYYYDSTQNQIPGGNTLPIAQTVPVLINTLYTNQTTCCMYNDNLTNFGQDWIYYYCATQSGCLDFAMYNVVSGDITKYTDYNITLKKNGVVVKSYANTVQAGASNADSFKMVVLAGDCFEITIDANDANNDRFNCINYDFKIKASGNTNQTPGGNTIANSNINLLKYDSTYHNQTTCCMANDNAYVGQDWYYAFVAPNTGLYTASFINIRKENNNGWYRGLITKLDSNLQNPQSVYSNYYNSGTDSAGAAITFCAKAGEKIYFYIDDDFSALNECLLYSIKVHNYTGNPGQTPGGNSIAVSNANLLQYDSTYLNQTTCCMGDDNAYYGQDWFYSFIAPDSGIYTVKLFNIKKEGAIGYYRARLTKLDSALQNPTSMYTNYYYGGTDTIGTSISFCANAGERFHFYVDDDFGGNSTCINYAIKVYNYIDVPQSYPFGGSTITQACSLPILLNTQYDSICLCCLPDPYYFEFCATQPGCLTYQALNLQGFSISTSPIMYSELKMVDASCNLSTIISGVYDSTKIATHIDAGQCYGIYITRYANQCSQFSINTLFVPDTLQTPGGLSCATASFAPVLLNTYYQNQRNCISKCQSNNIHSGANLSCLAANTGANDYVYVLKPGQIGRAKLIIDGITNNNNYPIEIVVGVYKNCNGSNFTNNVGNKKMIIPANSVTSLINLNFWVQNATDSFYFVMDAISNDCFKYNFILQFDTLSVVCNNADFELGNANGWLLSQGQSLPGCATCICPSPEYSACPNLVTNSTRHVLQTGGTDFYGGFPKVFAGNYSMRLGDNNSGAQGEGMELFFEVDATHNIFSYNYAVVFEDPGHLPTNQPFFRAKILDPLGNIITCTEYCVSANSNIPGFFVSPNSGSVNVLCKPWTTVNVDLTNYIGSIVKIQFENGDCADGGHFGYSYIDCSCNNFKLNDSIYSCSGDCDTLFAPQGYTNYKWMPGADTTNYKVVCPTVTSTYTLTYDTYTGCQLSNDYKVTVRTPFSLSHFSNCLNNGSAVVTTSIPANGFTYLWNTVPPQTNDTAINLVGGNTYIVLVSDSQCYAYYDTILFNPVLPILAIDSVKNVKCTNGSNGVIDVNVSSGTLPYLYQLNANTISATNIFSNLNIGNYVVTVFDSLYCKDTLQLSITQPTPLAVTISASNACIAGTPSIVVATVSGGTPGYTYQWSNSALNTTNQNSVLAGTYTFTATDANGCTISSSIIIQNGIQLNIILVDTISCPGKADGSLFANVLNNANAYTYSWLPIIQSNDTAINLPIGIYTVTVSNSNGCTGSVTYQLLAPPNIILTDSVIKTCNGQMNGAIYVKTNPINNYNYTWVNYPANNSNNLLNITNGVYTVTATNSVLCTVSKTITVATLPIPIITYLPINTTYCQNSIVPFSFFGADSIKLYKNNFNNFIYSNNIIVDTSFILFVVGKNSNGCLDTISITIIALPIQYLNITDSICVGQSYLGYTSSGIYVDSFINTNGCDSIRTIYLTVNPLSDTTLIDTICQGQSYLGYTTTGIYTATFANIHNCDSVRTVNLYVLPTKYSDTSVTICQNFNYLGFNISGIYKDTFMQVNGCDSVHSIYLTVLPNTASVFNPTICEGFSFNGYSTAGTFIDTFINANGCDSVRTINLTILPITYSTINKAICIGQSFNGYNATGTYIDTLVNANGCDSVRLINLVVNPLPIINTITSDDSICKNESVILISAGGVSYTYMPTNNLIGSSITITPAITTIYTITGTDANTCSNTSTVKITVLPLPIVMASTSDNTICLGDTTDLIVSGALNYVWNNGLYTSDSVTIVPTITNIYTVIGTDIVGCTSLSTVSITVNPLPIISINPANPRICINSNVTITASGGATYLWNGGGLINASGTSKLLSPIVTTAYTITATNVFGCTNTFVFSIIVDSLPVINVLPPNDTICKLQSSTFTATGASTYLWNPIVGLNNASIATVIANPLSTTIYIVIGTDGNGCTGSNTAFLYVRNLPIVTIVPNNASICRADSVQLLAQGASQYLWNPNVNISVNNIASIFAYPTINTIYTVVGTDIYGCSNSSVSNITVLDTFNTIKSIDICEDDYYTFNGLIIIASGTYQHKFTASNGCDSNAKELITMHPKPKPTLVAPTDVCINESAIIKVIDYAKGIRYYWNLDGGIIASNLNDTLLNVYWQTIGKKRISVLAVGHPSCDSVLIYQDVFVHQAIAKINIVSATTDYCNGKEIVLGSNVEPNYKYEWIPNYSYIDSPFAFRHKFDKNQTVILITTDEYNCKAVDSIAINVESCCNLVMPNAFSPNNDGYNDGFGPILSQGVILQRFSVYNRFGEEIFTTKDLDQKWNGIYKGKDSDLGVYQYLIQYNCGNDEQKIMKGDVTLVR